MLDGSQNDFKTAELDPALLSTPFRIQTRWHVITGASCSGKSTLIDQLAGKGFQTVPEVGRQYIEKELAKGRTIDEIRKNQAELTCKIYQMWVETEAGLDPSDTLFLDRALPDSFAFYRVIGKDPNKILPDCFQHHYASVFMLDRFPYDRDGVRAGDDAYAEFFDLWMVRDYKALGYDVIRVPILPPDERLSFILKNLSTQGLV